TGIGIGGLGIGAGENFKGIGFGGLGVGSPNVVGLAVGGVGVGGVNLKGIMLAIGTIKVENNGSLTGFSLSAFNQIKGKQNGLTFGIVNYARKLNGVQIGLINYVRDNPKYLRILPLINFHFE
ncbi:MAG: hypothetical protein KAR38_02845, partial [Calditrichia bacterium]|nr:hypothetical protein [Calditrichia bacterium]